LRRRIMELVTFLVPEKLLELMDELVATGMYPSRSDLVRQAVRDLIRREWPFLKERERRRRARARPLARGYEVVEEEEE